MPAKRRTEKKSSKKADKASEAAADAAPVDETPADKIRREGIVVTYAQNSKKIHRNVRDISVSSLTMLFHGTPLVEDAELTLNYGNRYGFIGRNGSGKSTFMKMVGARCFPIADGIDSFHLKEEIEATDMTAKEAVMSVDVERAKLEAEAEELNDILLDENCDDHDEVMDRLTQVYERLEEMDASSAEMRASKILVGLGFTPEKQQKKTKEFSGGWRMRIALARALFLQPTLLLLDEPTNHLDMEAVVWLEDYLSKWDKILLMVSHSQDFMNSVCTHIVHLKNRRLTYYTGNYDMFVQTRGELEEEQMRKYKWEQDQIKQMKDYVARFGHGTAKNAKQAQSKEKTLEKMIRGGLTDKVDVEKAQDFRFIDPVKLAPPVLQMNDISFGYPGCEILYEHVDLGVDLDSRVALVGPNGAGKSTLLKLMTGDLLPVEGAVRPHVNLRISKFSQHFVDVLDLTMTPLDYFMSLWPDMTREECRRWVGRFGVTGSVQTQTMEQLSDGQKSRVVLAKMAKETPHIMFLDEPTNHLDMESIDSLARAINSFSGGMVLVSHDMRLISQVAKEIWICDHRKVEKFNGEIEDFKMRIRTGLGLGAGSAPKSENVPKAPLAPVAMAPPLPPVAKAADKEEDENDALLKSRLELAEIAIQKQRARQAAEKSGDVAVEDSSEKNDGQSAELSERELKKQRREAEKKAAAEREAVMEAEKERRRLEKLADMEAARLLKETEDAARAQRQKEREEKAAKKKAEEDAAAAALAEAKEKRRQEKEARRRERELQRELENERRRKEWDDAARADPWTQEQQNLLEQALMLWNPLGVEEKVSAGESDSALEPPSNYNFVSADDEKAAKWSYVSSVVPGKTRNQCLSRFRFLRQLILDRRIESQRLNEPIF